MASSAGFKVVNLEGDIDIIKDVTPPNGVYSVICDLNEDGTLSVSYHTDSRTTVSKGTYDFETNGLDI